MVVDIVALLLPSLLVSFLYRAITPADNELEKLGVQLVDMTLHITIWWVYTAALLSSSWQATLGKRVCGIRVMDYGGGRLTFGRATGRYFASFLSSLLFFIGFFMIAWTRKRQSLHDIMSSTLVVKDAVSATPFVAAANQSAGHARSDAEQFGIEPARVEAERDVNPYAPLIFIGTIVLLLILAFVLEAIS